jgi:N-acetylneuraminic acid mutarotase
MFGGEYYDGKKDKMHVYNDLFMYHPDKNTWTQIMSPHGSVSCTILEILPVGVRMDVHEGRA